MKCIFAIALAVCGSAAAAAQTKVETMVARESAHGITADQITTEMMYALEQRVLDKARENAAKGMSFAEKRELEEMTGASSVLLDIGAQRLIVTRVRYGKVKPIVQVAGIVGSDFIRVLCIGGEGADLSVSGTDCERVAERIFDVQFPGGTLNG